MGEQTAASALGPEAASMPAASRAGRLLSVAAMLGVGVLLALQSQINGDLAGELGDGVRAGMTAAVISFGSGLACLSALVLLEPRTRRAVAEVAVATRNGVLRWWQVVGGMAGACVVASQGLTVATIGVALFTVAIVAGQSSSSLLVDHAGLGPAGRQRITTARAAGASLTVVAVGLAVAERFGNAGSLGATALGLALLPLAAGCAAAYQQAVNGQVNRVGGPWAATWINFLAGTALLVVLASLSFMLPGDLHSPPATWWLYSGGLIGVVFISAAAVLVEVHGVLVLGLCTVAGQVLGALAIDALADNTRIGALSVIGAVLTLGGVAVAASPGLRRG